ncbi:MAG: hypothetical protein AAF320_04365 [Myxococcota bacterium]
MPMQPAPHTITLPSLMATALAMASLAAFVFPTKAAMHQHVDQSMQTLAHQLHEHKALPNHPAQQEWTRALHQRLTSVEHKLEQVQVQLATLQAMLTRHCHHIAAKRKP